MHRVGASDRKSAGVRQTHPYLPHRHRRARQLGVLQMRKCPLHSSTFAAAGLVLVLTGCAGDPLDYETALNLLRERTLDPVKTSFSASPQFDRQPPAVSEAYQRLINEHVIVCNKKLAVGT